MTGDMKVPVDMKNPDMTDPEDMGQDMDMNITPDMDPGAQVVNCPEVIPAAPQGQLCSITPGNNTAVVLRGTVLADGKIYNNGAVVVDRSSKNGTIAYVGCDYASADKAQGATVFACADGVISPALINAHDHITYNSKGAPAGHGEERFDHRHDWRVGKRGHTKVSNAGNSSAREHVLFGELRHLIGGATSLAGSGSAAGLMRNLDKADQEGLPGNVRVRYETFPLGDSSGTLAAEGCSSYDIDKADVLQNTIYLPHVSEGIDLEARNEYFCMAGAGGVDLIAQNTSIIHGIGLKTTDIAELAADGGNLVWSPRSNIDLYGQTADVVTYDRLGVDIGMGTDWIISGSMNMLRELSCADYLNTTHYNKHFSDEQLWRMATANNAVALGVNAQLGTLDAGKIADITIFNGAQNKNHRAVIAAGAADVRLVLRGGQPMFGDKSLVEGLVAAADINKCEVLDVCQNERRLCAELDTGLTLDAIKQGADNPAYPLFFCDAPTSEPSCLPARPNEYSGPMPGDKDGDGVADAQDICPDIFNPARPVESNMQADQDGDNIGDSCDVCLFNAGMPCEPYDSGDGDGDGVPTNMDNCPFIANPNQEDADNDMIGDACDKCADYANPDGKGCLVSVYDIKTLKATVGDRVRIEDVIVSGSGTDGFFVQVKEGTPTFSSVDNSGVFVFAPMIDPKPAAGDTVAFDATVSEYQNQVQLQDVTAADLTVVSQGAPPMPLLVSKADIIYAGAKGKVLESVLVRVEDVTVQSINAMFGDIVLDNGLVIDDILYASMPAIVVGDSFRAVIGPISYRFGENRIAPRSQSDLITGPVELRDFDPAMSILKAGTTAQPAPGLVVRLTGPAEQDTTINLTYSDAAVLTGPATVVIPTGQSEIALMLQGVMASADVQTVTATYNNLMSTAQVTVYDDLTARALTSLTPATQNVTPGAMATLTVSLNLPAITGGSVVTISTTGGLVAPMMVTIPEGQREVSFQVTAPNMAGMGMVTASVGASMQSASLNINALPSECLIISEYVEGSSNNKAVEIYNCGATALDLSQYGMCLIGNANTSCSAPKTLSGMLPTGGTFVVCNSNSNAAIKAACQLEDNTVANFNGDDRLILFKGDPMTVIDAFGETAVRPATSIWGNMTLSRCDYTPYLGVGAFDFTMSYTQDASDVSSGLGMPPVMGCP